MRGIPSGRSPPNRRCSDVIEKRQCSKEASNRIKEHFGARNVQLTSCSSADNSARTSPILGAQLPARNRSNVTNSPICNYTGKNKDNCKGKSNAFAINKTWQSDRGETKNHTKTFRATGLLHLLLATEGFEFIEWSVKTETDVR